MKILYCLVVIITSATAASAYQSGRLPDRIGFSPTMGASLPLDAVFQNQHGQTVRMAEFFRDQPVLVLPVYYRCPMLCGLELRGLVRCLRALSLQTGRDFQIVTFSIDPREKPSLAAQKRKALLAELGQPQAKTGWTFLTGTHEDIQRTCDAIGFRSEFDPESGQYAHAAGLVVCTPDGRISRSFQGVEFLPRDVKLSLLEASQGTIGTVAEHIQLYCYTYDPQSGRYGISILRIVRIAGVASFVVLAVSVGRMLSREHHSTRSEGEET